MVAEKNKNVDENGWWIRAVFFKKMIVNSVGNSAKGKPKEYNKKVKILFPNKDLLFFFQIT